MQHVAQDAIALGFTDLHELDTGERAPDRREGVAWEYSPDDDDRAEDIDHERHHHGCTFERNDGRDERTTAATQVADVGGERGPLGATGIEHHAADRNEVEHTCV